MAIDDEEMPSTQFLLSNIFIKQVGVACIRSNPAGRKTKGKFAPAHEYALFYGTSGESIPHSLPKTESSLARYPKLDERGRFAWANFIRSGSNDRREDRPKLFYPIIIDGKDNLRIPKMQWHEGSGEYVLLESVGADEEIVLPISNKNGNIIEKNWQRGHVRVAEELELGEYRVRRDQTGEISIDFKTRMDEASLPITWWDDKGYASANYGAAELKELFVEKHFDFPKSRKLVTDCVWVSGLSRDKAIVLDFFAGSGTTAHAVINLNREDGGRRKYILVEMGEHFNTVILPRVKKVVYSDKWKDGKAQPGQGISHFAKYYELEQYEDTLRRAQYEDSPLLAAADPYGPYAFLRDLRLIGDTVSMDRTTDKVNVRLDNLYPNIDLAETLSCVTGKGIKRITRERVEFQDGTSADLIDPDWNLLKPLLWW